MALAETTKTTEPTYTINDTMYVLFGKLDEAIYLLKHLSITAMQKIFHKI